MSDNPFFSNIFLAFRADLEDAMAKLHLQFGEPAAVAETELQSAPEENATEAAHLAVFEPAAESESQDAATSQENAIEARNVTQTKSPESGSESANLPVADE